MTHLPSIEERVEEVMKSEPVERVLNIEQTAILSGRAEQYRGTKLQDVLRTTLTSDRLAIREVLMEWAKKNKCQSVKDGGQICNDSHNSVLIKLQTLIDKVLPEVDI